MNHYIDDDESDPSSLVLGIMVALSGGALVLISLVVLYLVGGWQEVGFGALVALGAFLLMVGVEITSTNR